MVVDDESDLLDITKRMLEKQEYAVHAFDNPITALAHVERDGCKECMIVMSDVRMPGMTGLELIMRTKSVRPEMKVVLMTGYPIHGDDLQKIIPSVRVDAFLHKPFRMAELILAIRECAADG